MNTDKFYSSLNQLNISLSADQMNRFLLYYDMLIEWNKVMNLTAITEFDEVVEKHFIDSLCLVKAVPNLTGQRLLDLGSGAGFPGIPLKIAFPDLNIVLIDSLNKRINFLNNVISALALTGISAAHARAEEAARMPRYRQQFDICVSRAVSNLSSLAEYCLPFVKLGGYFVSYKSADIDNELNEAKKAISLLGGKTEEVLKYMLPGSDNRRSLVCIKKINNTSKAYPRKAGTPVKKPL